MILLCGKMLSTGYTGYIGPKLLLLSGHMDWRGVKVDDTQALASVEDSTISGSAALQYKTVCHQ